MNRLLDAVFRRAVRGNPLEVRWASGRLSRYGPSKPATQPPLRLVFRDRAAEWGVAISPELRLGEGYMDGRIAVENGTIYDFLELVLGNGGSTRPAAWMRALGRLRTAWQRLRDGNDATRARRNVGHHYDLDARLYRLFLDEDLQYSCAYFDTPGCSLEQAQQAKKRHLAAKLALAPGQRVLDIGCGWGGLALYLAGIADVTVTGVTLSVEQHQAAGRRARAVGLDGSVGFELKDYREITGRFDRIVSVGMFEHVGRRHYGAFFRKCAELLGDDGVMVLHSIGRFGPPAGVNPWIDRYIFPGHTIPSLSQVLPAIERSGLIVADAEILRLHYAATLRAWRERFLARRHEAAALYDERFVRMWEFYLAGCEMAFRKQDMMVFQLQLVKDQSALPLTRDYITEAESRLALHDD
ncbi:MAG TPA: cyclopropane-fatty-acyl-phospholipid synthase family protein, partial [Afifellaceae bacterium]|nr:cyclopropane-fatty-acyl-phospholipid synthase family protein [Afifellaceae bacterium]